MLNVEATLSGAKCFKIFQGVDARSVIYVDLTYLPHHKSAVDICVDNNPLAEKKLGRQQLNTLVYIDLLMIL